MTMPIHHEQRTSRLRESASAIGHEEWLMDEALLGSFPASDPASSTQPGSIVNERYAEKETSFEE